MSNETRQRVLAAEEQALDLYLESLYEEETESPVAPVVSLVPNGCGERTGGASATEPPAGDPEPAPREGALLEAEQRPVADLNVVQVLLFDLSGLKMAIPMGELDGILDWPEQLLQASEEIPFCLGMLPAKGRDIPVIDLARLIVPARLRAHRATGGFERLLLIGGRRWGLACHGVGEVVTVEHSAVNWRKERPNRKWLAGTISSHGSALLDAGALEQLLRGGEILAEG